MTDRSEAPVSMTLTRRLAADGCDVRRMLPPAALIEDLIALATAHADALDIGFTRLDTRGRLWVLGRLAVEMTRWPAMYDEYSISTRVISFNRLFSERCFDISVDGQPAGESRTVWTSIYADSRRQADLSDVVAGFTAFSDRQPLMAPVAKIKPVAEGLKRFAGYTFGVTDLDFNGHVTTKRYIELMLNCVSLDEYRTMSLRRFDLLFHREALCGDRVDLMMERNDDNADGTVTFTVELIGANSLTLHSTARFILVPEA
ncbi:MAG: hypothetical protein K2M57_08090 [Paramuribaculum sp.]|nr:hypothetical protein [Paramuribaculum sp.]